MSIKSIDQRLKSLLMETYPDNLNDEPPYQDNRIFTNRNIKLNRVQAMGFDLDYTLAQYNAPALDTFAMGKVLEILVRDYEYPPTILNIKYDPSFAIRGLIIDTKLGNVLKLDKFRYVSLAYHGLCPLDSDRKAEIYNSGRISYDDRFRSVDTLFELLETFLFAAMIDLLEPTTTDLDYSTLFEHLRNTIDLCHRDDTLKREIMANPERYLQEDPMLIPALHKFRESGKRLFLVTNSESHYTEFILGYLFRNASPYFSDWRHCFEIVVTSACKPKFFTEGTPMEIHEDGKTLYFSGGNVGVLEEKLQVNADKVLYVGDHIYGDILKSKHLSVWRTCIIVPELKFQINAEMRSQPYLKSLISKEARRKQLTMELNWRRGQMLDLQQFKESEADELELRHLEVIDDRISLLNRQIESDHKELSGLLCESQQLRREISNCFNPYWGRLFKAGGELSIFAEQIRDYACIYTSSVSNFNYYSSRAYLESLSTPMPHEQNLYSVGDLNFDVSMEAKPAHPNSAGDEGKSHSTGEILVGH